MTKIQFTLDAWLKDKSQKVETRDGRVVHNIWRVKEPFYTNNRKAEVCALIDGEEDALVFFEGGRYLPTTKDTDSPFDLFIVTPEEGLTEFESKLKYIVDNLTNNITYRNVMKERFNRGDEDEQIKEYASELLAIARKELEQEWPSIIQAQSFNAGLKQGKVEALKDLPRWRKCADCTPKPKYSNEWIFSIDSENVTRESAIVHKGYFLPLDGLEKLPGFKED